MSFKGQVVSESFVGRTSGAKGKRGGLRVIYFYWVRGLEFWLFTLYDKNELSDLSKKDRATLEGLLKFELKMRKQV
jgi:hypothetical protein